MGWGPRTNSKLSQRTLTQTPNGGVTSTVTQAVERLLVYSPDLSVLP